MRFIILLISLPLLTFAQTGPAGVGNSASNRFWQDAFRLTPANGTALADWTNFGGNTTDPTQTTVASRPLFYTNQFNSIYPGIRFDGVNDYFNIANNTDMNNGANWVQRSYFIVFRTGSDVTNRQIVFEEGGTVRGFNFYIYNGSLYVGAYNLQNDGAGSPWGFFSMNTPVTANTSYLVSFIYNGNDALSGTVVAYLNGTLIGTLTGIGRLYAHNPASIGGKSSDAYFENGPSGGTGNYLNGTIAELIHYNYNVNTAQRYIIENSLSAKYNIPLGANDMYVQDNPSNGNYDHDVCGIGRTSAVSLHTDAQGLSILRILNPTSMGDNEFLIWGHNNLLQQAANNTDVPAGVEARFERVWRCSEVNLSGTAVNVGNVDLRWDLSSLGTVTASDLRLLVDTDNDGLFSDETPISGASSLGGTIYAFTGVSALTNNTRFTLATINKVQTPLPVGLLEFTAQNNPATCRTKVQWSTATESANQGFYLQRSHDGQVWAELQFVPGAGNAQTTHYYEVIDSFPLREMSYYRLIQQDYDGQTDTSEIRAVYASCENAGVVLYPNPAKKILHIRGPESTFQNARIVNANGQVVYQFTTSETKENQVERTLNVKNWRPGTYYFKSGDTVIPFLKQN